MILPDKNGHFGIFGGRYVAETLMPALLELEKAYQKISKDKSFKSNFDSFAKDYIWVSHSSLLCSSSFRKIEKSKSLFKT